MPRSRIAPATAAREMAARQIVENCPNQANPIEPAMNDASALPPLPDHLSTDARSPHHVAAVFEHDIGIKLNGIERFNVEEYCVSEGWVKVPAGKTVDRKGQPLLIKLKGRVEAFYR